MSIFVTVPPLPPSPYPGVHNMSVTGTFRVLLGGRDMMASSMCPIFSDFACYSVTFNNGADTIGDPYSVYVGTVAVYNPGTGSFDSGINIPYSPPPPSTGRWGSADLPGVGIVWGWQFLPGVIALADDAVYPGGASSIYQRFSSAAYKQPSAWPCNVDPCSDTMDTNPCQSCVSNNGIIAIRIAVGNIISPVMAMWTVQTPYPPGPYYNYKYGPFTFCVSRMFVQPPEWNRYGNGINPLQYIPQMSGAGARPAMMVFTDTPSLARLPAGVLLCSNDDGGPDSGPGYYCTATAAGSPPFAAPQNDPTNWNAFGGQTGWAQDGGVCDNDITPLLQVGLLNAHFLYLPIVGVRMDWHAVYADGGDFLVASGTSGDDGFFRTGTYDFWCGRDGTVCPDHWRVVLTFGSGQEWDSDAPIAMTVPGIIPGSPPTAGRTPGGTPSKPGSRIDVAFYIVWDAGYSGTVRFIYPLPGGSTADGGLVGNGPGVVVPTESSFDGPPSTPYGTPQPNPFGIQTNGIPSVPQGFGPLYQAKQVTITSGSVVDGVATIVSDEPILPGTQLRCISGSSPENINYPCEVGYCLGIGTDNTGPFQMSLAPADGTQLPASPSGGDTFLTNEPTMQSVQAMLMWCAVDIRAATSADADADDLVNGATIGNDSHGRPIIASGGAGNNVMISHTDDAGVTWPKEDTGLASVNVPSMEVDKHSNSPLTSQSGPSSTAGILNTTSDWRTNTHTTTGASFGAGPGSFVSEPPDSRCLIGIELSKADGSLKTYRSGDGGATWPSLVSTIETSGMLPSQGIPRFVQMDGALFAVYAIASQVTCVRSPDNGVTWGTKVAVVSGDTYSAVSSVAWQGQLLVMLADSTPVMHLWASYDLGATWSEKPLPPGMDPAQVGVALGVDRKSGRLFISGIGEF